MIERPILRSVSPEIPTDPPSWYVHMKLFTETDLELATAKRLANDLEARWPGSEVSTVNSQTIAVALAVASDQEPSIERMIEHREELCEYISTTFSMGFTDAPDAKFVATPIESEPEQPIYIGRQLTGEVTYADRKLLTAVPAPSDEDHLEG